MALFDTLQQIGKAVAGAAAGAIGGIAMTSTAGAAPGSTLELPNTTGEWLAFAVTVILGFALPFLKKNYPTVAAAVSQLEVARARVAEGKQTK